MNLKPKPVPGYEENYFLDPETLQVINKKTLRPLKPQSNRTGYPEVQLWKNNKGKHAPLHRLFGEAYVPNPHNLPCINHKDEDISNYNPENLEWCTQSYNQKYGTVNERRGPKISASKKGQPRHPNSGRPARPVIAIDGWGRETRYPSGRECARQLGIRQSGVTGVLSGERRTSGGYRFRYAEE